MKRNETLLIELNNLLDNIKKEIKSHNIGLYESEVLELGRIINSSLQENSYQNSFFEKNSKNNLVKPIMIILEKINKSLDKSIDSVEISMGGVLNYSKYESEEVEIIAIKQSIKNNLNKMLDLIVAARPDSELPRMIKKQISG